MLCQDIDGGEGVTLIDPHGHLAEGSSTTSRPSASRTCATSTSPTPSGRSRFNILDTNLPPEKQHLTVSAVVAAFCGIWNLTPERAPRLLNILKFGVAALLETPDATLLSLERLLTDEAYRVRVVTRHSNDAVRRFWLETFDRKDARFRTEAIDPVLTRVSDFGIVPLMQRIVGQPRSGFDVRTVLDERTILICNLDIGQIGEENAQLLGALLLTKLELAARGRTDLADGAYFPDHYLYVDEFHRFPNERWANILSGIRAYRLVAHARAPVRRPADRRREARSSAASARRSPSAPARPTPRSLPSTYRRDLSEPQFTGLDNFEINVRLLGGRPAGGVPRPHGCPSMRCLWSESRDHRAPRRRSSAHRLKSL